MQEAALQNDPAFYYFRDTSGSPSCMMQESDVYSCYEPRMPKEIIGKRSGV